MDYALSHDFAVGMFNSCRDVQMPSANERAISLLCGHTADQCTPQNWLDYMGNTANQQTPFTVNSVCVWCSKTLKIPSQFTQPVIYVCVCVCGGGDALILLHTNYKIVLSAVTTVSFPFLIVFMFDNYSYHIRLSFRQIKDLIF